MVSNKDRKKPSKINHPGRAISTLKYPEISMPGHPSLKKEGKLI
jgi:hypothetical protein